MQKPVDSYNLQVMRNTNRWWQVCLTNLDTGKSCDDHFLILKRRRLTFTLNVSLLFWNLYCSPDVTKALRFQARKNHYRDRKRYFLECLWDVGVWTKPAQFLLDVYQLLQAAHAGSHCSISSHRCVSYPSASCCLCLLYAGWCEQVETERQNEWAAEAAARWTREISWEIDNDKSHTLRLPGRQLSVEEAAGTISHKWHWVSLILCLQHVAARWKMPNHPVVYSTKDKEARCAHRHFIWLMCLQLE